MPAMMVPRPLPAITWNFAGMQPVAGLPLVACVLIHGCGGCALPNPPLNWAINGPRRYRIAARKAIATRFGHCCMPWDGTTTPRLRSASTSPLEKPAPPSATRQVSYGSGDTRVRASRFFSLNP